MNPRLARRVHVAWRSEISARPAVRAAVRALQNSHDLTPIR